ncbi:hypothetical protein KKB18_06415 [bacterium]|nr:hypothetical protein [bacterium]
MEQINNAYCPNKNCKEYGLQGQGNISIRGKYGKGKERILLYCRTCGKRFSSRMGTPFFGLHLSDEAIRQIVHHAAEGVGVRATARLLGLGKDTVNRVVLLAGEHCALVLSNLLISLKMTEVQLVELWSFIKKREVLMRRMSKESTAGHGSGRH